MPDPLQPIDPDRITKTTKQTDKAEDILQPDTNGKFLSPKLEYLNTGLRCDYEQIEAVLEKAIAFAEQTAGIEPAQLSDMYLTAGLHFARHLKFDEARSFLQKSYEILPAADKAEVILNLKSNLLTSCVLDGNTGYQNEIITLLQDLQEVNSWSVNNPHVSEADLIFITDCYLRTAHIFERTQSPIVAAAHFSTAEAFSEARLGNDHLSTNYVRFQFARYCLSNDDLDSARKLLLDTQKSLKQTGEQNTMLYVQTFHYLANCCLNNSPQDLPQASRYLGLAIRKMCKLPDIDSDSLIKLVLKKTSIDEMQNRQRRVEKTILEVIELTKGLPCESAISKHPNLLYRLANAQYDLGKEHESYENSKKLIERINETPLLYSEFGIKSLTLYYYSCRDLQLDEEVHEATVMMCTVVDTIYPGDTQLTIKAQIYTCRSNAAFCLGLYEESLEFAKMGLKALYNSSEKDLETEAKLIKTIACICIERADTENAVKFFEAFNKINLELDDETDDKSNLTVIDGYIGMACAYLRASEPPAEHLQKAMQLAFKIQETIEPIVDGMSEDEKQDKSNIEMIKALVLIDSLTAQVLFKRGSYIQAEALFLKALEKFTELESAGKFSVALCRSYLGQICMQREEWEQSLLYFASAAETLITQQSPGMTYVTILEKSAVALKQTGRIDEADIAITASTLARKTLDAIPNIDFEKLFRPIN